MGAKTLISPEEYLSTHYEWEPEYVRGELRERPMPDTVHAWITQSLIVLLRALLPKTQGAALADVRCRMPNGNYRLPDIGLFMAPLERVPTRGPLVAVEVVSDSEKYNELIEKLYDFELWGVPNIWVISPRFRTLQLFESGALRRVDRLTIPEYNFEVRYEDLVAGLPDDI